MFVTKKLLSLRKISNSANRKNLKIMFTVNTTTEYLLERDYDSKIWQLAGEFDRFSSDSFSDGTTDRTSTKFTEKEAKRFNDLVDGDGSTSHIGIIITKNGLRFTTF